MTADDTRREIRDAIEFYDQRGRCWISVVTFIGIRYLFGGWSELLHDLRPYRGKRTA